MNEVAQNCNLIMERLEKKHIVAFPGARGRVILASDTYPGVWLEHVFDGLALAGLDQQFSDVALGQIRLFLDNQKPDGQLPAYVLDSSNPYVEPYLVNESALVRYTQIQECVSFIRLCREVCRGNKELLEECYPKCVKWDGWMERYRMKDGLIQAYCAFDTGHDNSARFEGASQSNQGLPVTQGPQNNVAPITAIDMSAVFYGGRMALAEMAEELGNQQEAEQWRKKGAAVKKRLFEICYDKQDDFFYDQDKYGQKIPYRTIAVTALFCEHMLTKQEADRIYLRHFKNSEEFGTPYPFPAVAVNDPGSRPEHKGNSWSFYSQGLTALRALRWMDDYGYGSDLERMMNAWLTAWTNSVQTPFGQELHPITGEPSGCSSWYTPTMLFYVYAAKRLGYF